MLHDYVFSVASILLLRMFNTI